MLKKIVYPLPPFGRGWGRGWRRYIERYIDEDSDVYRFGFGFGRRRRLRRRLRLCPRPLFWEMDDVRYKVLENFRIEDDKEEYKVYYKNTLIDRFPKTR